MFKYFAPVDIELKIPQSILSWAMAYEYVVPVNTLNIPRQIDKLINANVSEDAFPKKLKFHEQEIELTYDIYQEIRDIKSNGFKSLEISKPPHYSRIELPEILKTEILSSLPDSLKQYNPNPVLQVIEGEGMLPHTDYTRKSSLYYLITEPNCDTLWYESNGTIDLYKNAIKYGFLFSIANIDHIHMVKQTCLTNNRWYVFDNYTYHSILSHSGRVLRKGIQLEFNDLSAMDLYNLLA
jgi:hypothetical protein